MKLKSLLFMVTLLLCCLGVRAQGNVVFEEHFATEPTDPSAVGYYEFINNMPGDERTLENGALKITNDLGTLCKTERWQRAVKFRNLPLKEGIYRLDFKLKGSKTYNDGESDVNCKFSTLLMQGEDNADISLLDFAGNEQRLEGEDFNEDEYVNYSKKFIFASEQQQKEKYAEQGKGELADKYFLTLSVYNPGTFFLKDVVLSETNAVQSVEFGVSAIKVSFGSNTNIADLAKADEKGMVCFTDLSYATVLVDGEPADVEAIEYHSDGCLYIFTTDEFEMDEDSEVAVTFTNPEDENQIKFNSSIESAASMFNFTAENAIYNEALDDVLSYLWLAPALKSSYPANGSFAIDKTLNEFTFTFDRPVQTAIAQAVLNCDGVEQNLIVKPGQEALSETVIFVRNDNGLLAKRNTISLTNIKSKQGKYLTGGYVVNFEAGKPNVAKEIYTPVQIIDFSNDNVNTIPVGWTLVNDYVDAEHPGEVRPSGSSQTGGGPRLIFPGSFYVRTGTANAISTATYGDLEGNAVTLPVGDLRIQFLATGYKGAGQKVRCELLDATGQNVLASVDEHYMENITADGKAINTEEADKITIAYKNETEQNAIIRYTVFQGNGMTETMLGGVNIYTYEKTEGDVPDDKYLINETFAQWSNSTPAVGSGWEIYDHEVGGKIPGGTNPGKSRILGCNGTPFKQAYFCRVFGGLPEDPQDYMTYGAEAEGPKLTLEKGIEYEMTYYAATWNDDSGNSQVKYVIFDPQGQVASSATNKLSDEANAHNNAGTAFVADKFTYKFTPSTTGDYVLKFWGSNCTLACGNITFVQPGSRAVKYYALLATAVENGQAALDKCADEMYNGATKTALTEAVAKYEDPDQLTMTTEEEFKAAIEEVEGLTKSMLTRYEYIPRFKTAVADAKTLYNETTGTKYEKLDSYLALEDALNMYGAVDPSNLEDDELVASTTTLENNSALLKNMKSTCVNLLTNQIVGLANQLVEWDEEYANDKYVVAALNEAVTDDQEIAYQLKLRLTKVFYEMCAEGDPFVAPVIDPESGDQVIDPETGEPQYERKTFSANNFIQNANFYSTGGWPATVTDFPGWTIELIVGKFGPSYGTASWGGEQATAIKPVVEAAIRTDWGTHEYDAKQLIENLPVAIYNASIIVGEDGSDPHEAYGYLGEGDDQVVKYYDGETPGEEGNKFDRDTKLPREFNDVAPNRDAENLFGSILLGAHARVNAAFARVDNAALTITGKAADFDYAEAAAKLAKLIGDDVRGDANGDGEIGMPDVMFVINYILGTPAETFNEKNADANLDGEIGMPDVMYIINYILNGKFPDEEQ